MTVKDLISMSLRIKKIVIEQSMRAHVGHIGCSISIADILAVLYGSVLSLSDNSQKKRDHFILSKGHAALGLYAAMFLKGIITQSQLHSYHTDGTQIGTHPEYGVPGVELATGSLGQGIGVGAGVSLAKKMKNDLSKTIVLMSDAECNEGSVWEAVAFAHHHSLHLIVVIDMNGQQGFGMSKDIIQMEPMSDKWKSFGWKTIEVDGHDLVSLQKAFKEADQYSGPCVILARTVLGKGISFMERKVAWHYLPLTDELYVQALSELAVPVQSSIKKKGHRA